MSTESRTEAVISVYLALIFVIISSLIFALIESAYVSGTKTYAQIISDSSIDSVFSEYDKELWEKYGLLLLYLDPPDAEQELAEYAQPYLEAGNYFVPLSVRAAVTEYQNITDSGGEYLEQEIIDYMKSGIIAELLSEDIDSDSYFSDITEADTAKEIVTGRKDYSAECMRLDEKTGEIEECIESLKKYKNQALNYLRYPDTYEDDKGNVYEDYSSFYYKAQTLASEMYRLSHLINEYEIMADELDGRLLADERLNEERYINLDGKSESVMRNQIESYRQFTDPDGKRRREIASLDDGLSENVSVIHTCMNDPESSSSVDDFESIIIPELSFSNGVSDKRTERMFERASEALGEGLLDIVIPEGRSISETVIYDGSGCLTYRESLPSFSMNTLRDGQERSVWENILITEYVSSFFSCFTDQYDGKIKYETEYIISGKSSDRGNLSDTLGRIFGIREGLNYLSLLADSSKMKQVHELATAIVGATGTALLIPVVSALIIGVWAGLESTIDVKRLLSGGKVAFFKNGSEWKSDKDMMINYISSGGITEGFPDDEGGWSYESYLKMLIMLMQAGDRNYRMMDIIQTNIEQNDINFQIQDCLYSMNADMTYEFRHRFTTLSLIREETSLLKDVFTVRCNTSKTY